MEEKMSYIDNSHFDAYYSYPNSEYGGQAPLSVVMAGDEQCAPAYRIYRDHEDIGVLIYVLSGEGWLETDGKTTALKAGDVLAVPSGTAYAYGVERSAPWRILWFNLAGELYSGLLKSYGLEKLGYASANGQVAAGFFQAMERCRAQESLEETQDVLCRTVYQILLALWRQYHTENQPGGTAQQLRLHMDKLISLDQSCSFCIDSVADVFHLSARQLERTFKCFYGLTPYRYFQRQKLALAKQYLKSTALSVKEISTRLGFCDQYYFSNQFKAREGVSPKAFRKP